MCRQFREQDLILSKISLDPPLTWLINSKDMVIANAAHIFHIHGNSILST